MSSSARASQSTAVPAVPLRTPMFIPAKDSAPVPALSRTWSMFFEELIGALSGIGGMASQIPQPIHEAPAGTIDGVNTDFLLTYSPFAGWVVLHLDNALEDPIADYTLTGNKITYTTAPQIGDTHHAWYLSTAGTPPAPTATPTPATTTGAGGTLRVPATAATYSLDWEDQFNGGDGSFGNGSVKIVFDGAGHATITYTGHTVGTIFTNNFGIATAVGSPGSQLVGASAGAGPVAIPGTFKAGDILLVFMTSSGGHTYYSGPGSNNPDGVVHARIT